MRTYNPRSLKAVDPIMLARQTGITKGGVAWRPYGLSGMGNLGFMDLTGGDVSGDISNIGNSVGSIINAIDGVSGSPTGVVDVVPFQNQIFNDVIVPISNLVNSPNAATLTTDELQQMLDTLNTAHQAWDTFITTYPWATSNLRSRALAGQATLAPYWTLYVSRIQALMINAPSGAGYTGGIPGVIPLTLPGQTTKITSASPGITGLLTAGFSSPLAVGLGVLALYLFSQRRGK